jgi:hypothetical protein
MSKFLFKMTSVAKLLLQIAELKSKEDRIEALKVNGHPVLKNILKYTFDPNVKFLLPEGNPPYKENIYDEPKALLAEANKIYLFIEGGNPNLKPLRREQLFIQLLEAVSKEDAKLLLAMKDKKGIHKNINKDIVEKAFPELFAK